MDDLISRKAAKHALCKAVHKTEDIPCENQSASCLWSKTRVCDYAREIDALPPAQQEIKPIDYQDCANAMLLMWMDKVVTDGEYSRIMDKLNAFWRAKK